MTVFAGVMEQDYLNKKLNSEIANARHFLTPNQLEIAILVWKEKVLKALERGRFPKSSHPRKKPSSRAATFSRLRWRAMQSEIERKKTQKGRE